MAGESKTTPYGRTALKIGISSVVSAAALAVGSLVYYSFGFSSENSALNRLQSGRWPEVVKNKIQAVYVYLFFSFYICVASAVYVFCDPVLFKIFSSPPMVLVDFLVQTIMQSGRTLARLNAYGIVNTQRAVWFCYCAFLGAVASPVFLLGLKTARLSVHLTCIIFCFLTLLSYVAPLGKFMGWKQSLSMYEIAVFIASIGAALFPITSTAGAIFFSISFYGGLILYPICFLCHSQDALIQASEQQNTYCSVAMSVPMLLDIISVFGRVVVLVPSAEGYH